MKFEVKNVGPIVHANLEFKDKVVIVGQNSSGKTTLASLFYFVIYPFQLDPNSFLQLIQSLKVDENAITLVNEHTITVNVNKIINDNREAFTSALNKNLKTVIDSSMINENSEISTDKFVYKIGKNELEVVGNGEVSLHYDYVKKEGDKITLVHRALNMELKVTNTQQVTFNELVLEAISKFFISDWYPAVFLSTERVAIPHLLPLIYYGTFSVTNVKPFKPQILDPLRWDMSGEYEVLGHKVVIKYDLLGHLEILVYKDGKELGKGVASGIYQYVFIKAFSTKSNMRSLIIEEPELNLHPDAQIEVAKEIAKFNKKLFITTHSEWISMVLAYLLRSEVKVYEIVNGVTEERTIDENGLLETLKTIIPVETESVEKMIEGKFL
ncbi:AAA family ATPase [Sulfurisphaera javensis]|uniref:AAA family ATPase n=1 Tax=Sulfurisphaera javensis TaxID=2049879 RepID=A0AAT9GTE3_9CREN